MAAGGSKMKTIEGVDCGHHSFYHTDLTHSMLQRRTAVVLEVREPPSTQDSPPTPLPFC